MLTLYKYRNSICTQKVLIALAEKELAYQAIEVNLFKNEQYSPDYLKLNPKGVVPTLVHDGEVVIESTLICEYLDGCFPEPPLVPRDPYLKTRMRLWSKAIDEGLFDATRELSFSAMFRERLKGFTEEQRQQRFRNVGDPNRRARYESCYELGVESPYVLQGIAAYEKAFRTMESDLAVGGPWLLGEFFSLADVNMMPFVARLDYLDLLDVWTGERLNVVGWWKLAQERPAFIAAIPDVLTREEVAEMRNAGTRIKTRVRERRAEYLSSLLQPGLSGAA